MRKYVFLSALLALGAGGAYMWRFGPRPAGPDFKTVKLHRGDVLATVSATGTLEPEEVVDVGAQVTGQILAFGRDPDNTARSVNYGSRVEKDMLLATIDDAPFKARLDQAKASLKRSQADLLASQAKARQADRDWRRAQEMWARQAIGRQEYDQTLSTQEQAQAAQAQAQAALAQAQASLEEAEKNLGYTKIYSPVKGVVIDRRVNIGQTLIANLNPPSLFLIAKDLSRMEVWASVNEVDFGHIKEGQKVCFSVAAYPGKTFRGVVSQIRLNASVNSTVVTYPIVVAFDNTGYNLAPYLTANLQFEVDQHKGVLKLPNSVLRWRPRREQIREDCRAAFDAFLSERSSEAEESPRAILWKREGAFLVPIEVRTGLTDGAETEVITDQLDEGDEVVSGENYEAGEAASTGSPTIPQLKTKKLR
jgi:HlyD family secretion protein